MPRDLQTFPEPQTLRAPDDLARSEPTLREFLAWVKARDPNERYNYFKPNLCALAMFGRERGYPELVGGAGVPSRAFGGKALHALNTGDSANHTYGELASRLEALSARAGEEVAR